MNPLPSTPGTHGHLTSKRPTATRSPDGFTIVDFTTIDNWADFVRVLTVDVNLQVRLMNACTFNDPRLKAYTAVKLHEAMGVAFQVTLDDSASEDLAEELDAARQAPEECFYCSADAVVEVSGIHMCAGHAAACDEAGAS